MPFVSTIDKKTGPVTTMKEAPKADFSTDDAVLRFVPPNMRAPAKATPIVQRVQVVQNHKDQQASDVSRLLSIKSVRNLYDTNTKETQKKILAKLCESNRPNSQGYVYGFTIDGDEEWCKIGRTVVSVDRRIAQQHGKPLFSTHTKDCFKLERLMHLLLKFCNGSDSVHQGIEWFHIGKYGLTKNMVQKLVCDLDDFVSLCDQTEVKPQEPVIPVPTFKVPVAKAPSVKVPVRERQTNEHHVAKIQAHRTPRATDIVRAEFEEPSEEVEEMSHGKVNINTASKETFLTDLAHCKTGRGRAIGDKLADRIIAYRSHTPFRRIEDLILVPYIGPITYNAVKNDICV
ncbi:Putative competence protein ComEA [Yasminevirus sp. GU-2018]|uniref:Competence protein ComEA n=1 Tax=Yasminevirus sp. GU-2018 TaxID=2420051 RepID=A0A5K0U813_9VIRU|nr:Putative competence protein ComEA [Yasminevirus sp. GU-2018]